MGRTRLQVGEHGQIVLIAQLNIDGKWKERPAGISRKADRWRGRCYYRALDGELREVSRFADTSAKARAAVVEALAVREDGNKSDDRTAPATPFAVAGRQWVQRIERADSRLAPRSIDEYRRAWFRYFDSPGSSLRGLTLVQVNDPQRLGAFLTALADERGTGAAHTGPQGAGGRSAGCCGRRGATAQRPSDREPGEGAGATGQQPRHSPCDDPRGTRRRGPSCRRPGCPPRC